MHQLIKSFFYSVALLTMFWLAKHPADDVTLTAWVHAMQSEYLQQTAYILTAVIYGFDQIWAGMFSTSGRLLSIKPYTGRTKVGYVSDAMAPAKQRAGRAKLTVVGD